MKIWIIIIIARIFYKVAMKPLNRDAKAESGPPVINRIADPAAYTVRREFDERI